MTYRVELAEAQAHFLELIQAVMNGDAVLITKNQQPVARIIATQDENMRPQFGSARGLIEMTDDFDAPLEDFREYMP